MLMLENLRRYEGRYILPGGQPAGRRDAMRYLQRLNEPRVRTHQLPCGATVERRYTTWKTRVISI